MTARLLTTLVSATKPTDVRHLILQLRNDPASTLLYSIAAGVPTQMGSGTEYDMTQKAQELAAKWAEEGFSIPIANQPVFEPLKHTVGLALALGFTVIYDPREQQMMAPGANLTGAVQLTAWPGMTPSNGGGYEYAFVTGMNIYARPTLPPHHKINMHPANTGEFVDAMQRSAAILETVGPAKTFPLG